MSGPRRLTDRPFPPYRHVPGETPHPLRDPAGYAYERPEPRLTVLDEAAWPACPEYLYGVDLFNHGYWWECHEVLEGLWHAAGHRSPAGECLQAVIQCAVAHLKAETGNLRGARLLLQNAERHASQAGSATLGLDLQALLSATHAYVHARSTRQAQLRPEFPADEEPA
ncbi:MAG TPA: DUF309 domain-containing protein [Candidatus Krumholzibacteria bacterium]|nr:DUF309 domain-containing protein [Candidatus Krumholzibacteria bacterium]HRX51023.1 DUF309 domain-containing protein [Candidatus Krumholzibacteria bacterium]